MYFGGRAGTINDNDQFLPAKQLQYGARFAVIILQARLYGFGCVIGSRN